VIASDPNSVATFVLEWLDSYYEFLDDDYGVWQCRIISPFGFVSFLDDVASICSVTIQGGSYGAFLQGMFASASASYGDDGFESRLANAENRVTALQHTDSSSKNS